MDFLDTILKATKEYWFLITVVASIGLTVAYMVIFRINPWDQQRAVKLRRDRVRFHNTIGYGLLESGYFTNALNEFEESLKLSPEDPSALHGKYLSNLFINFDAPDADPALSFAIQRHLQDDGARRDEHLHIIDKYLGDFYIRIWNEPRAMEHYQSALERKPDYPNALYTVGWMRYQEGPSGVEEMGRLFRRLTEVNPYDYRGFHGLGYALYMKAIAASNADARSSLIREAAEQSGRAINVVYNQLNILMDFGEIARSVDPRVSISYHEQGRKIASDPVLSELGENRFPLLARLLLGDGEVSIPDKDAKLAWIAYQLALDYLAMERIFGEPKYRSDHDTEFNNAQNLDPKQMMYVIYEDQRKILDLLLPAPE